MKPLSYLLLLFISVNVTAQTSWLVAGNTATSGDFLGTTNTQALELKTTNTGTPQPINFYTGNTQKATILANGNVGIGTTTPASVLHLNRNTAVPVVTQYTNPNALATNGTGFQPWLVFSFIWKNKQRSATNHHTYSCYIFNMLNMYVFAHKHT